MLKLLVSIFLLSSFLMGMSLNQCIRYALRESTAIKKSKNEIEISNINRNIQKVSQFGEINLVAEYNHYNSLRTLAPLTPSTMQAGKPIPEANNIFSVGFLYKVPLFTGFAQTHQLKIEQIASKMSKIKSSLTKEEIIYNVKSIYLTILAQEELLNAQRTYYKSLKRLERVVKKEVQAGRKAKIDYIKAQTQTQETLSMIEQLKSAIEMTKASLSALIGKDVRRVSKIKIRPKKLRYSTKSLLKRASYLKKVEIDNMKIKRAERAIKKTKAQTLPQVNLSIYAGKNLGDDDIYGMGVEDANIYQVGVHGNWNLVDFGKRNMQIQKAKISKMQLELDKVQTIRNIKKSIKSALAKIKESYSLHKKTNAELRLSLQAQKIESARYKSGVSTINDLLLAKAKTQLAKAKSIESKYNYQKSLYYLDYILEQGAKKR
jgi:outer membrane protein TolC